MPTQRNAAQLRADATATGWFNGPQLQYVGDGFTVPWEVALPAYLPVGLTFWIYKQYLDARWLEASRLHDWLYTPYGGLIHVTREEADSALREEIALNSIADAEIVYRAVRFGGAPYFGTSQTGVAGFPTSPSVPNMPATPNLALRGGFRMPIKVVIVFQQATKPGSSAPSIGYASAERVGGWTEHVWSSQDLATTIERLRGPRADGYPALLPARATILSTNATILGVRLYQGGAGRGQFVPMGYPGAGGDEDIPQMALLCASQNPSSASVRRWTIRGIPDGQIKFGEFDPSNFYAGSIKQYFDSLTNFVYYGKDIVVSQTVFTVNAAGLVTLTAANPYAVGAIVTFKNVLDSNGIRRGGQFIVSAVGPGANNFTVAAWPFGDTTKGSTSIPTTNSFNITGGNNVAVERAVTRKVGRPFAGYRGRRSKKRVKL